MIADEELIALVKAKQEQLERKHIEELSRSIWLGATVTATHHKEPGLLTRAWRWLRWRFKGTWNVWRYGECLECEREDW